MYEENDNNEINQSADGKFKVSSTVNTLLSLLQE